MEVVVVVVLGAAVVVVVVDVVLGVVDVVEVVLGVVDVVVVVVVVVVLTVVEVVVPGGGDPADMTLKLHVIPWTRPELVSAIAEKAVGVRSMSPIAQPVHRSTIWTTTERPVAGLVTVAVMGMWHCEPALQLGRLSPPIL